MHEAYISALYCKIVDYLLVVSSGLKMQCWYEVYGVADAKQLCSVAFTASIP
jgi:hypothetical protein